MLTKNIKLILHISHTFYNKFCDRIELSSQYRTQATRWCIYGLLSYAASSPAVAGHSSYEQFIVRADVRAGERLCGRAGECLCRRLSVPKKVTMRHSLNRTETPLAHGCLKWLSITIN